jgi:hypothetical protein
MARTTANKLKGDKRYVDAPRYKAIYGYEDDFKKNWKAMMSVALTDITNKLKQ